MMPVRNSVVVCALLLAACPPIAAEAGSSEGSPLSLALRGATLIDGTGASPVPDSVVLVRGGRIDCAGSRESCTVPSEGVTVLDVTGKWITPGLVDAHVHFSQTGWADGRPDSLDVRAKYPYEEVQARLRARPDRWFRSYLCSGVTAVFDVGGYPWTWGLRQRDSDSDAPHVEAAGPLLSTLDFWLNLPAERQFIYLADEETGRAGVRYLAAHGTSAVKVWFIVHPGREFDEMASAVMTAGEEARRRGVPLIVHATGLREAKVALRAGAHLLVHSVSDRPVDEEFIRLAGEQATAYCPTLTVRDGYRRMYEAAISRHAPSADDPNGCLDAGILERAAESARVTDFDRERVERRLSRFGARVAHAPGNLKRLHEAGIPIAMGTDAGNPLTFHGPAVYAEMEAMQEAGLTPMEVLSASTRGGALAMGRLDDLGTVEAGKVADLLVVSADPTADVANLRKLHAVVRAGVLRTLAELRPQEKVSGTFFASTEGR